MDNNHEKNTSGIGALLDRIRTTQNVIPFPAVVVVLLLLLAVEIVFLVMVVRIGLLPGQYLALIIVILMAIDAGIIALLGNSACGRKRYYSGMIIAVLLMILLLPGAYFINDAHNALKKLTRESQQWEKYEVITCKDSGYETVSHIKGKKVYVQKASDKMSTEARERLVTKADVEVDDSDEDIVSLGNRLVDEQGMQHEDLILVSSSQHDILNDEIKGFKKGTKVIYELKVKKRSDTFSSDVDVTKDPFNVYVTGIDAWGEIDKVSRSDVNMIVTINPQTRTILLTSMPRDSYVVLHSFGQLDKLTHSGIYGVDETLNTVSDWLGVDFDFFVKVNFTMVVKLVDAMGGIAVQSDYDFHSSLRPQYHYKKGRNAVGGYKALYFARERKSFEKSDEQRILNQQRVMEGIINKVTSHKEILLDYKELLGIVSENMATNLTDKDLSALARMQLADMNRKWTVQTYAITGTGSTEGTYSMGMGRGLYVSIPNTETVDIAKEKIHDVMYPAPEEEAPKTNIEQLVEDQMEKQSDDSEDEDQQ